MTGSDFPRAAARISEGFCALCGQRLDDDAYCEHCDVGWTVQGSGTPSADDVHHFGAAGVLIIPSRRLAPDEIKGLYARPSSEPE